MAKIIFITYISPAQAWGSGQRSRLLIDALKRHGHVDVLVLNFKPPGSASSLISSSELNGTTINEISITTDKVANFPRFDLRSDAASKTIAKYIDLSTYDLIFSRYIKPALKLRLPAGVPVVVDFDDAIYTPPWYALNSLKMWIGAFTRLLNDRLLVRLRLRARPHAHYFFCREAERLQFPALPSSILRNLPSVPTRSGPPPFDSPSLPALMFVGLLDYMPNTDAVDWFLADIWPQVRVAVPDARFLVVGSGAPALLQRWAREPGVEALGFVESLADAYAQATVCVVPMRGGAGTNIKALEAFHYGKSVVSTQSVLSSFDGLFRDGIDMLSADDANAFAAHCIALLQEPARAESLARSGYERLCSRLSKEHFMAVVDAAVTPLLAPSPTRPPTTGAIVGKGA